MLTENTIHYIEYKSIGKQDTTQRHIIPVTIPKDLVRAIDVSECDDETRAEITRLLAEYKTYQTNFLKSMFTFEAWADHTGSITLPELKWRTFKVNNITEL